MPFVPIHLKSPPDCLFFMTVKKGDFISLNFTGKLKDSGEVFDTTVASVAKEHDMQPPQKGKGFEPLIIVVGEHQVIPGLDKALVGKEVGKNYSEDFADVDAFGKKRADLMKLVPMSLFKKENLKPFPGLQVNVDDQVGTIRSVSGGRVIVDFNHPLSSKDVTYDFTVEKIISDMQEKVKAFATMLHIPSKKIEVTGEKAIITMPAALPEQYTTLLSKDMSRVTGVKEVEFVTENKPKNNETKNTPDKPAAEQQSKSEE